MSYYSEPTYVWFFELSGTAVSQSGIAGRAWNTHTNTHSLTLMECDVDLNIYFLVFIAQFFLSLKSEFFYYLNKYTDLVTSLSLTLLALQNPRWDIKTLNIRNASHRSDSKKINIKGGQNEINTILLQNASLILHCYIAQP